MPHQVQVLRDRHADCLACGTAHMAQPHGDGHRVRQERHAAGELRGTQRPQTPQPPMERRQRARHSLPICRRQTTRPHPRGKCRLRVWRIRYRTAVQGGNS